MYNSNIANQKIRQFTFAITNNNTKNFLKLNIISILLCSVLLLLSGCMNALPLYNQNTYDSIGNLHLQCNELLVDIETSLGTDKSQYSNFSTRYLDTITAIDTLGQQQFVIANNEKTVRQLEILGEVVRTLESVHKAYGRSGKGIHAFKVQLDTIFTSMKKLENSKPRK